MTLYDVFSSITTPMSDTSRSGALSGVVAIVLPTFIFVTLLTRILTETSARARSTEIPLLPYWLPYLGHALDIYISPQRVLQRGARFSVNGSFALYIYGRRRVVLCTASAVEQALKYRPSGDSKQLILHNVAGVPPKYRDSPELLQVWHVWTKSLHAPSFAQRLQALLQINVPNLVTGAESRIDEAPWEKNVSTKVTRRTSDDNAFETECELFQLLDEFSKSILLDALVGPSIPESSSVLAKQLRALSANVVPLGIAIPQWLSFVLPMPGMLAAHRARHHCLRAVRNVEAPEDDTPFDTLNNALPKAMKSSVRTRLELACLWDATKDVGPLLFWLILHVLVSSQDTLDSIQNEAKRIVLTEDVPPIVPGSQIKEPPRLAVNNQVLEDPQSFPVLYAYYLETVRLYSQSVTSLGRPNGDTYEGKDDQKPHLLSFDPTYVSWGLSVGGMDAIQDSTVFNPHRYLEAASARSPTKFSEVLKVLEKSLPGMTSFRPNDLRSIVVLSAASVLLLWEIKHVGSRKSWQGHEIPRESWLEFKQPEKKYTLGISLPAQDVKVSVSRLQADKL